MTVYFNVIYILLSPDIQGCW